LKVKNAELFAKMKSNAKNRKEKMALFMERKRDTDNNLAELDKKLKENSDREA